LHWRFNGANLPGATNAALILTNVSPSEAGRYSLEIRNSYGVVVSSNASLTVRDAPPQIRSQPTNATTWFGGQASFQPFTEGTLPVTYQWLFQGKAIPGATKGGLFLTNVTFQQAGSYSLLASNQNGALLSSNALLVVVSILEWDDYTAPHPVIDLTNAVAVAAGEVHNMALRSDGTVSAWGQNTSGQTLVPVSLSNAVAIAAGSFHSVALRSDGTVIAWGANEAGQTNVPPGLSNVVGIAAGDTRNFAVKRDGHVVGWGNNDQGQISFAAGLSNIISIVAGNVHAAALREDGTVAAWTWSAYGTTRVPLDLSNVVSIAAGNAHVVALMRDGTLVGWGSGNRGQLNFPASLTNVVAIAAGGDRSLAVTEAGTLLSWGGYGPGDPPAGLSNVLAAATATWYTTPALSTHTLSLVGEQPRTPANRAFELQDPILVGGRFAVQLATAVGRVYSFEWADSLENSSWSTLYLVVGDGQMKTLTDQRVASPRRFYRVRRW
jgi:hypothetical protein